MVQRDDYVVDGIDIDWNKAWKLHDKLNALRKKHGIRQIPPIRKVCSSKVTQGVVEER